MVIGGCSTALWDTYGRNTFAKLKRNLRGRKRPSDVVAEESVIPMTIPLQQPSSTTSLQRRTVTSRGDDTQGHTPGTDGVSATESIGSTIHRVDTHSHSLPLKWGILIIVAFFASFIAIMVARGTLDNPPLELNLFTNMYLAGTIIFGGGPVVIPLLREYVVEPGWVTSRDFLIGLALIQAFPGPNFNFAVFLGALAMTATKSPTVVGSILGYVGIFLPGLMLAVGFQSCWRVMRKYQVTTSILRGMNSTAVGLVFTAVYRLWEIGYLSSDASNGQSLGKEPFWLVVAALAYAENAWFSVPPAIAIIFGGILDPPSTSDDHLTARALIACSANDQYTPPTEFSSRNTHQHQSKMGRLHSKGKGISSSAIPYSRNPPAWLKTTPDQVVDQICKLAKKGATPSQIGVVLRDSHGIAQVKVVTGNKILRILKSNEDLYMLIKKAVSVRKHLERNRKDKDSKFRLILIESRIHRLSRYYKTVGVLPPTWRYESATASTLVA
ncbi:40S ribosomal protein S13 [Uncinocarpus reesii 1704]|uniref:40S ribosomal protein S13 n=1 Tax=Uncinocarpus reesii (strain UAMH 1704) TaxID=336963 RepID=C4JJR3_UNCRE|nr:40S ribosomal protein S13 [Uncinocarpus reesii 1704]EEP77021.1 40S ribosomal protein S13 [Uncinocarpus reesii 1704]